MPTLPEIILEVQQPTSAAMEAACDPAAVAVEVNIRLDRYMAEAMRRQEVPLIVLREERTARPWFLDSHQAGTIYAWRRWVRMARADEATV